MSAHSTIRSAAALTLLAMTLCSYADANTDPGGRSEAVATTVVQFDAIIALNAPLLKTHVVLFARYWVAPSFYKVAVLWAEPHALNLNFPMYPVTMAVDSNEQSFSVTNQVQSRLGRTFIKPVGERAIFRHRLNNYAIGDLRFTESEAVASRVHRADVGALASWMTDGHATVDLAEGRMDRGVKRAAGALDLHVSDNRVDGVDIVDANGLLVKRIAYEYSQEQGRCILRTQEVLLPERPLLLGYGERGITIRVNDNERTFKELYGLEHEGGRKCRVEYQPVETGATTLPLPGSIVVRRADSAVVLRTARMSNFLRRPLTAEELECAANQVGQFSREELRVRALFAKYWPGHPSRPTAEDTNSLQHLREHFERAGSATSAGLELRRINMLLQLDSLQGRSPANHFRRYLTLLGDNGLNQAAFLGGLNTIDTAVRRERHLVADELVRIWADHMIRTVDAETLLTLARAQMKKGHSWCIVRLMEEGARAGKDWTL